MRRVIVCLIVLAGLCASMLTASAGAPAQTGGVKAGVARADLSWHVGAGQGQYGSAGNAVVSDRFDPYAHSVKQTPSDGLHARIYARALVVEGTDGTRVAYVGHDLYLQQDMLHRRVAQLVGEAGTGIDREHLMISASHNHSAPYMSTSSYGVWLFTDAFDARHFEYASRQMAQAVIDAAEAMRPVRMGASVVPVRNVQQNILGPRIADDGSPAGFPRDQFDTDLAVVRFDDVTDPARPEPYAALVNFGMHPESLASNDMPSPDFVGTVERIVTRELGLEGIVWSQGAVGDSEPDQSRANPPQARKEFWHRDYAQMERMSRSLAGRVVDGYRDVAADVHEVPDRHVPFATDFPVRMVDRTFAGPATHPVPSFANCRLDPLLSHGDARGPGVPTCMGARLPVAPGVDADVARDAGVPVPDQYSPPSYGGVQESVRLHLQVMQLGEVVIATCPCEPISDMVLNFKSRADAEQGDIYDGYDWACRPAGMGYECNYAQAGWRAEDWRPVSAATYERMRAQIHNDARGWEEVENANRAESEPSDPARILGNFTKEEVQDLCEACSGFTLPLVSGTSNDYVGYIVTYREYQSGDHYRKALTAFGPHSADYVNTRLVRMAAELRGGPRPEDSLLDTALAAEEAPIAARLAAITKAGEAATRAWETAMPDDGGDPAIVTQPSSLQRFGAAQVRWAGGNHFLGTPEVRVERLVDGQWRTAATQDGEIQTTLEWKRTSDPATTAGWAGGRHPSLWTATFEVFDETQPGTYRFRIEGRHRKDRRNADYSLTSNAFDVTLWTGVQALDPRSTPDTVSFAARAVYPETYTPAGVRYISAAKQTPNGENYCFRCTFRAWATSGRVIEATVTLTRSTGSTERHAAVLEAGRWVVRGLELSAGDRVDVSPGDVRDEFGNTNGVGLTIVS